MKISKTIFFSAGIMALLSACIFDGPGGGPKTNSSRRLFVTSSDFLSGALLSYTLDSLKRGPDSLQINQDSRVIALGGSVYVLERFGADNLLKYDPVGNRVVYQKHLGDGWNPADLVANGNTGFVSLEEHPKLLKVDLLNGNILDSLDISTYTYVPVPGSGTAATSPNASRMVWSGDTLFVALQRRNGDYLFPNGLSLVLMVRMSTFTILDTLLAPNRNAADLWLDGGNLYLACTGTYGVLDGVLYRISLANRSFNSVITDSLLSGKADGISCLGNACAVKVYRNFGDEPVRLFNLSTGALGAQLGYAVDSFGGLAMDSATGVIYVGDRNPTGTGIQAFSASGVKFKGPVSTGLPPSSLAVAEF